MADIKATVTVEGRVTLHLTEVEAAALEALIGYGTDPFLKVFYKHLGESYLKPHEKGVRSLFATIGRDVPHALERFKAARLAFMMPNPSAVARGIEQMRRKAMEEAAAQRLGEQACGVKP
jgi:hypothetical protein